MSSDNLRPQAPVVLVVGMHRSGTSALARVLDLAGLAMPGKLLAPNQDNPKGYWEPVDVVALNTQLLQRFDRHWSDPKPLDEDLWDRIDASDVGRAVDILQAHGTDQQGQVRPLVIKDPRLCRVAPFWIEAAKRAGRTPLCLLASRHPENVYWSLHARERMSRDHALDLWLAYTLEAERGTRGHPRMVVHYDALLADWRGALGAIHQQMGVLSDRGIADAAARIDAFLDSGQRHHDRSDLSDAVSASVREQLVASCYGAFAHGAVELDESRFDALRRQWRDEWQRRSPGAGGSDLGRSLPAWHAEQAAGLSAAGDHAGALAALQRAIALGPDIARFHFLAGNMLVELSRPDEAAEHYAKAVEFAPSVVRFHKPLLQLMRELKRHQEAADVAQGIAALEPSAAHIHELGLCLAVADQQQAAVEAQQQVLRIDPQHARAHLALGRLQDQLARPKLAMEHLAQAMQAGVTPPGACDRLGHLYAECGRWQDAVTAYSCALERRQALFGFRAETRGRGHPPPGKAELCALLARLGVRYWSERLLRLFERQAPTDLERQDTWWPIGSAFPYRPHVEVPPRSIDSGPSRPLLSVMVPVYNVADSRWLKACLDSVLAQDKGPDWAEIVVVDDASDTDRAREIVDEYGGRVRYERNRETLGLVGNHNHCIELARGECVHLLHQDDTVEPGFYDAVLDPMVADERLVAAFTHNRFIDAAGNSMGASDPPRPQQGVLVDWHIRLSLEIRIQFPCIVVRRSTYAAVGGFYPGRRFSFDWDLWNRVAASGPVWYDPRPLANFRVHPDSATYRFRQKERVIDAMQTVANMVQLAPIEARAAVAEMGMYKFFLRYWSLITAAELGADAEGRMELAQYFLEGWTTPDEQRQLLQLLDIS